MAGRTKGKTLQKSKGRRKQKGKRILCLAAALAALLYMGICNILVNVTLVPEVMEKTAAFGEITEESVDALVKTEDIKQNRAASLDETKRWAGTASSRKVTLTSRDGWKLVGRVFYQEEESRKWVLLLHGYTGWKEEMYPLGCEYAKRGFQVVAPDMRCSGESEGDFIGMGYTDRLDNMLWISYILEQDEQAQIVIHGQSMGAACALMMTGEELPRQVKAVVADSAYTDVRSIFQKQLKDWFGLPGFPLIDGAGFMLRLRGGYDIRKASALEAVKRSKTPTLVIHGTEDAFVPAWMGKELYEAAACKKQLLLVEGAGHVQAAEKDPERYYGTVFQFLEEDAGMLVSSRRP